jgi:hypothetical protein
MKMIVSHLCQADCFVAAVVGRGSSVLAGVEAVADFRVAEIADPRCRGRRVGRSCLIS